MPLSGNGTRQSQRNGGFALLLILAVVIVIGAGTFFAATSFDSMDRRAASVQSHALAEARRAVILYAVAQGASDERAPGALICVDTSAPNDPVHENASGPGYRNTFSCNQGEDTDVVIGRLPVRDLGLDPKAAAPLSEIWYAIDFSFRDHEDAIPVNPETSTGLSIDGEEGFAAVLLLPSAPTSSQNRHNSSEPEDYLAAVNHGDDTEFFDCSRLPAEDDTCRAPGNENTYERVVGIHVDALFAPVQKRVLAEIGALLRRFHQESAETENERFLPWASRLGSAPDYECEGGLVLGHLALTRADDDEDCAEDEFLNGDFQEAFADWNEEHPWIADNDWFDFVLYHVDPECDPDARNCAAASTSLDGSESNLAVIGGSGRELVEIGQDRDSDPGIGDYLDQSPNSDNDPGTVGTYRNLRRTSQNNDVFRGIQ